MTAPERPRQDQNTVVSVYSMAGFHALTGHYSLDAIRIAELDHRYIPIEAAFYNFFPESSEATITPPSPRMPFPVRSLAILLM
jgi:hypothetical protein